MKTLTGESDKSDKKENINEANVEIATSAQKRDVHMSKFHGVCRVYRSAYAMVVGGAMLPMIPVFVTLSKYDSTYTYLYAFVISVANKSGYAAGNDVSVRLA